MSERSLELEPFHFRPAVAADLGELAEVLACAFQDDPLTTWFVRHDAKRPTALRRLFRWYLRDAIRRGWCYACVSPAAGAALWTGDARWKVSMLRQMLLLPELVHVVGMRGLVSRLRGIDLLQSHHPQESHSYLAVLGTHPGYQRQGIGSHLLSIGLGRCDELSIPAYLETANLRNIPFYEKNGFKVTGEIKLPYSGPLVWQMWRASGASVSGTHQPS